MKCQDYIIRCVEKRKRSRSDDDQLVPAAGPHVINWLGKRKKKVPDALLADQHNQMQIEQIPFYTSVPSARVNRGDMDSRFEVDDEFVAAC
eukprot:CAMPEP_0201707358 /NCGR_PEP_ID=MMETSP0578-20130828/51555_1 /ASSEMBLY_ACC=CAM_ASM_000663 /TAXON_ID=267565 /ORGANISM="Skeletonema grethea, Strain CCMP 1804" /LENGTH=90 /DNA_ID=CAMNT_0048195961 /DNA_START=1 /DNA_END=270 /DNA_ORIENTATION=-